MSDVEHNAEQTTEKLAITGRDRFLMETVAKQITKGITDRHGPRHEVTDLRYDKRGCHFDLRVFVDDQPTGHVARVSVELDRIES